MGQRKLSRLRARADEEIAMRRKATILTLDVLESLGLVERKGDMVRVITPPGGEAEVRRRIRSAMPCPGCKDCQP